MTGSPAADGTLVVAVGDLELSKIGRVRRSRGEERQKMAQTGLKALAQNKRLKVGHFVVEFATPGIGHIMKNAGCDFVLVDLEHSGFGFVTVKSALRYMQALDEAYNDNRPRPGTQKRATSTSHTPFCVQIETADGVKKVDSIAVLTGV